MYALLFAASVAFVPHGLVATETADVIELNHFYDKHGAIVFEQVIFWDWSPGRGDFEVFAWRMVNHPFQVPLRDWRRGGYVVIWYDGDVLRRVRAPSMRETWTQHDPELADREHVPQHRRRGLLGERRFEPPAPVASSLAR